MSPNEPGSQEAHLIDDEEALEDEMRLPYYARWYQMKTHRDEQLSRLHVVSFRIG